MRACAQHRNGARRPDAEKGGLFPVILFPQGGFTLLEMCIVLFIIVLLLGVMVPAVESARVEKAVRDDAQQLSLMVKTAMLQSSEEHRPYVIDLSATSMALHPLGVEPVASADPASTNGAVAATEDSSVDGVETTTQLNDPDQLMTPDPVKANVWIAMPPTSWVFQPDELCPVPRVRLSRGDSWVEMGFNALTGNVEDETAYFP